jgi:UPF0716 protein FxsA
MFRGDTGVMKGWEEKTVGDADFATPGEEQHGKPEARSPTPFLLDTLPPGNAAAHLFDAEKTHKFASSPHSIATGGFGVESTSQFRTGPMLIPFSILIVVPIAELYFLIRVGGEIGALPTIGLTILTAVVGAALVRVQGFTVLARVREAIDRGEVPAMEMLDGALLLAAGLMLLLPGFFTDALGFLLLVPPLRRMFVGRFVRIVPHHTPGDGEPVAPRVIEGEYRRDKD